MVMTQLAESVKDLYGGLESLDIQSALADEVINQEEFSQLAGLVREENYARTIAERKESVGRRFMAEKAAQGSRRRQALATHAKPGCALRGNRWVPILTS